MSNSAIDIYGAYVDNYKNKLINGNFDIWQRGRALSGATYSESDTLPVTENIYLADRWFRGATSSDTPTFGFTAEQGVFNDTDFGTNGIKIKSKPEYYMQFASSFDAGHASQSAGLGQRIENARTLSGKQVTLSFWAKGSVSGDITARISQNFGSGSGVSDQVDVSQNLIRLTTSWLRYTLTFDLPNVTGMTFSANNDDYVEVFFHTYCAREYLGLTGTINSGATVDYNGIVSLSEVQLEEGPVGSFFDRRFAGTEYAMCQRYFEHGIVDYTTSSDGTSNYVRVPFSVVKKDYAHNWDSGAYVPVSGTTLGASLSNLNYEDNNYTFRHSIAGLSGSDGVATAGDENLDFNNSGITHVTPDGFSLWFDTNTGSPAITRLRGAWVVDAEL